MIVRANRKTVLEPWGEMTIKYNPNNFRVLYTVPMMVRTKVWEPDHVRKGEGTGRFKQERSPGKVMGTVFIHLKDRPPSSLCVDKAQDPSCHSHFTYVCNSCASKTSPILNPQHGLACLSLDLFPHSFLYLWLSVPLTSHVLLYPALFHAFPFFNFQLLYS